MLRLGRQKLIIGALLLLLAASLAANAFLYREASRALFEEHDRPLIDRTVALFARLQPAEAEEIQAATFPMVMHLNDGMRCVELRRRDGLSHYTACYDRRDQVVLEMQGVSH